MPEEKIIEMIIILLNNNDHNSKNNYNDTIKKMIARIPKK
jgi:hypothetical protein